MNKNENKIIHLGFIQSIINRMANNSFLIKSFAITFTSALLAFLLERGNFYISIIPIILFWWFDAYFLHQEKLYRKLYEKVANNEKSSELFSLSTTEYQREVDSIFKIAISNNTLLFFYGVLLIINIGIIFVYC